ncbi:hypothetical protein [Lysinibacillus sp. FSL P4-0201]|uniref:hypothetical protein n=1 Tax=Lysinibacillus sp. FSL P4-0201 TaxID=2921721 RepID=UPI00315A311D
MKIEINVQDAHLKAEEIQENHVTSIIEGFFGVLGVAKQNENNSSVFKPKNKPLINLGEAPPDYVPFQNVKTSAVVVPPKIEKEKNQQISKVLPKVNGERTLTTPISEMAKINCVSESESLNFGTKEFEDGQIKYQCKYWCDCGHTGKRWVSRSAVYAHCHECNSKLIVEPATPEFREDGLPVQDSFNNFFIAREVEGE